MISPKLAKDIKIPFQLDGIVRIDDTPVHKAIREALANCIVNADFYQSRGIVIRKDADSIVMENPGSIRTGKKQMLKGGISDPRNKALMKMLNMLGIGERAGSGVPDIYSVWEQQGWQEPEVEEQYEPDRTILKLSFLKKVTIKSGDGDKNGDKKIGAKTQKQLKAILDFMEFGTEYRTSEISEVLGVKDSRTKKLVAMLVSNGNPKSIGNNRNRRYTKN